jgi:cardiolipin synthase
VLENGAAAFPAMLKAIEGARQRISFETYVFGTGRVADDFARAFTEAAARGVEVRLVLDAVGASDADRGSIDAMEHAGVRIGWFNPIRHWSIEEVNYRTHRKVLVVDGDVGFTGGIGIADQWLGNAENEKSWRDTHFEVHGPAVGNMEAAFHENWIETGGIVEARVDPTYPQPVGIVDRTVVVWSSPEGGANEMKLAYLLAIGAARTTIDIQSPYLITDESTGWSLSQARKRGVRIRMLTEGDITDAKPVKFASRAEYAQFLAEGMEVYEYQPTMMHTKAMVIDGLISIIGSANFDNRSLELNDELNSVVSGKALADRLTRDFENDLRRSKKLDLRTWQARPIHIKAREKMWNMFGEIF